MGRAAILTREVEEDLVKNLHVMKKHGFGLTRKELLETVGQFVSTNDIENPFKNQNNLKKRQFVCEEAATS